MTVVNLNSDSDLQVDRRGDRLGVMRTALSANLDFHGAKGSHGSYAWHPFPAKFPPQLPEFMIRELSDPGTWSSTRCSAPGPRSSKPNDSDAEPLVATSTPWRG